MMKYLVRSLKYFVYLSFILVLFILVLCLLGLVPKNIDLLFVNGWKSIPQMAVIVAVFAAVYPKIGFTKRNVPVPGDDTQAEEKIAEFMKSRKYVFLKKVGADLVYRRASVVDRIVKMCEDTIYFKRIFGGYEMEGLTKDVARLDTGLAQWLEPSD
ncbi:MAG TPA: hypothetical protein DHU75_03940 [Rikenellaceae bacterium]|nr:hypothetical protein [Rikenellaceae bacterium]